MEDAHGLRITHRCSLDADWLVPDWAAVVDAMRLPDKPSFTVSEAVTILGVGRATVYRWLMAGELDSQGIPYHFRITRQSLEKKLSQLSQPLR